MRAIYKAGEQKKKAADQERREIEKIEAVRGALSLYSSLLKETNDDAHSGLLACPMVLGLRRQLP